MAAGDFAFSGHRARAETGRGAAGRRAGRIDAREDDGNDRRGDGSTRAEARRATGTRARRARTGGEARRTRERALHGERSGSLGRHESGPGDRTLADGRGATHARDGSTAAGARHREAGHRHAERGGHRRRPCLEECRHAVARGGQRPNPATRRRVLRGVPSVWISLRLWETIPHQPEISHNISEIEKGRLVPCHEHHHDHENSMTKPTKTSC